MVSKGDPRSLLAARKPGDLQKQNWVYEPTLDRSNVSDVKGQEGEVHGQR